MLVDRAADTGFVLLVAIRTSCTRPSAVVANMSVWHVNLFRLLEHVTKDGRDGHHIDDTIIFGFVASFVHKHLFVVNLTHIVTVFLMRSRMRSETVSPFASTLSVE